MAAVTASDGMNDLADSDEEYDDANETIPIPTDMDIHEAIKETIITLNLFLNNHFTESAERMKPWADRSMYHALGYGTILFIQAAMTFEPSDIEAANTAVKKTVRICQKTRRKTTMMDSWRGSSKNNYDNYTINELHAEVCYAECLIERAILTFIQDESLISFVKGSLKIRDCYQSFKECQKILDKRKWSDEDEKIHFESGVCMGIGIFNLMISLLPQRILKLLEFVGFSGNKKKGLAMLEKGAQLLDGLRGPLCTMGLLGYHTMITYVLGIADGEIGYSEQLIKPSLERYPKGALFLFFSGRIEEIKGNINEGILRFEESVDSQSEWRQFHHLCFWELMWCHAYRADWLMAMKYAENLCRESKWSKSTYNYQKACFLLMCEDQTSETDAHVSHLLRQVTSLKQRIAGKSIPFEKFAVKKAKRFAEQKNYLTLAAYELIYVWNGFTILGKKDSLLNPILANVEQALNDVVKKKDELPYYYDDYCLALLLKGVCLRYKKQYFQAEQCLKEIQTLEKKVKQDHYIVPYSLLELATLHLHIDMLSDARTDLNKAKHNYKGFSLESRLHFRIHAANMELKSRLSPTESQDTGDHSPTSDHSSTPLVEAPYEDDNDNFVDVEGPTNGENGTEEFTTNF